MGDEKIILPSDPEAATYKTDIKGWVSRDGFYYGEGEELARYSGSTHRACEGCGTPIQKNGYTKCGPCLIASDIERYNKRERRHWNGTDGLFSEAYGEYFFDSEDLDDFCEDHDCSIEDLRLIICVPQYAREIDPKEYYCDDLPEDGEVPDDIIEIFDELNSRIRDSKAVLSWSPGKFAAIMEVQS
jgi:hypothetical protein